MVSTRSGGKHSPSSPPPTNSPNRKRAKSNAHLHATVEEVSDPDTPKKKPTPPSPKKPAASTEKPTSTTAAAEPPTPSSSSVLESGTIYFFLRGKVDIPSPESLDEVKRTHIVLHPSGAQTYRLLAVPKKKLPSSTRDRFLTILEAPNITAEELKEQFLKGRTYETKTMGERTDYPVQVVGEGVYVLTNAGMGGGAHLAYVLSVPEEIGEVQKELGVRERGSWVVRVRNPETSAPPGAGVAEKPEYTEEILKEFNGLKWGSLTPQHLDYKNAEVLFIGEKQMPVEGAHKEAGEELEKLEDEDEDTVEQLKETDEVFQKLDELKGEFGNLKTSWD